MKNTEEFRKALIGKQLKKLLFTKQSHGEELMPGIGHTYYFRTVMEIADGKKYDFGFDWIMDWNRDEPLYEVTHDNWEIDKKLIFNNVRIKEIILDEYDEITFRLENDVIISQGNGYGVSLDINNYADIFNSDGTIIT